MASSSFNVQQACRRAHRLARQRAALGPDISSWTNALLERSSYEFWRGLALPATTPSARHAKIEMLRLDLEEDEMHEPDDIARIALQLLRDAVECAERGEMPTLVCNGV